MVEFALEESFPGQLDRWEHFKKVVRNTASSIFGMETNKTADWFESHYDQMTSVIVERGEPRQYTKLVPANATRRPSELLAAKFSRPPGDVQRTTGFSPDLRYGQQLVQQH